MSDFRAYGVVGVATRMANWNADFDGFPKTIGDQIIGSDKAFKYGCRNVWEQENDSVNMYFKTLTECVVKGNTMLVPKTLKAKYESTFGVADLAKVKDKTTVIKNILTTTDAKNFGFTFAESDANAECTGVVQITQGINVYDDTNFIEQPILSPFKDKEEAKQSTLGTMVVVDKAQYMYGITVNPKQLDKYVKLGLTDGYTKEDYNKFKKTAIVAATALNTASKVGAENNFAIFVETDDTLHLGNLAKLVKYSYIDGFDVFNIDNLIDLVKRCEDRVTKVEIYYNPYTVKIKEFERLSNLKTIDILTTKEI